MNHQARRMGLRLLPLVIGLVAIGFMVVRGCQEGPFGRKQVVALNPEQEEALGRQAFAQVLQQQRGNVIEGGRDAEAVQEIARRLVRATENKEFLRLTKQDFQKLNWQVRVIRSREVNAFCLPGGKIVVYTGIMPVAETDAGLAVVMGHEISHALAHHGAERMAQQQMTQVGVLAAGASLSDLDDRQRIQIMQVINAGAQFGILKYSRSHESEADRMGLLLMAAAGYDPRESIRFWERMQRHAGGRSPPEFASTHPSHDTRISDLHKWLPEAMPLFEASTARTTARTLPLEVR